MTDLAGLSDVGGRAEVGFDRGNQTGNNFSNPFKKVPSLFPERRAPAFVFSLHQRGETT